MSRPTDAEVARVLALLIAARDAVGPPAPGDADGERVESNVVMAICTLAWTLGMDKLGEPFARTIPLAEDIALGRATRRPTGPTDPILSSLSDLSPLSLTATERSAIRMLHGLTPARSAGFFVDPSLFIGNSAHGATGEVHA